MDRPRLIRILLICGSLRAGSTNEAVLRTAQESAPEGVEGILYHGMGDLPLFNPTTTPWKGRPRLRSQRSVNSSGSRRGF